MMGEEEEEKVLLDHWSHEHPLTLVVTGIRHYCFGCCRYFSRGEKAYGCSKDCGYPEEVLHQECAEMAMKIRHPMHPQHTLIQKEIDTSRRNCDVCERTMWCMGYCCTSPECLFRIHIGCGQYMGVMEVIDSDDDDEQGRIIQHGSHPQHELRLLRRGRGSCSFKCDACGSTQKGSSYICSLCQYWIHERCAFLNNTMKREDHLHSLSLSFGVPYEYILYDFKCDVCNKHLVPKYWVYHCHLCRYVVHLKCAFKKSPIYTKIKHGKVQFPINDVAKGLIRPFIRGGGGAITPIPNDDEMVNAKYDFHSHKHKLSLVSSSPIDENEERENSDDDDDYGTTSDLICDGCVTPIVKKNERSPSSPSSSSSDKCYYMSCSECKYFLHYECFHLPPHLRSLPFLHESDHDLVLQSRKEVEIMSRCDICWLYSNGLFYACTRCTFIVDIKCASLPYTIYHEAHPQHLLKFILLDYSQRQFPCSGGCGYFAGDSFSYVCDTCEFVLENRCFLLPTSTIDHEWDKKHPLMLTFDARLNHPDEFYCDQCEEKMNPKTWMYHCRHCDLSFHPKCFPATSGFFRNVKFGKKYVNVAVHPHPLTFQLLTTKGRCDLCHSARYNDAGFHCASCNFFICLRFRGCSRRIIESDDTRTID